MKLSFKLQNGKIPNPPKTPVRSLKDVEAAKGNQDDFTQVTSDIALINGTIAKVVGLDGGESAVPARRMETDGIFFWNDHFVPNDTPPVAPQKPDAPSFLARVLLDGSAVYKRDLAIYESEHSQWEKENRAWQHGGLDRASEAGVVVALPGENRFKLKAEAVFDPAGVSLPDAASQKRQLATGVQNMYAENHLESYELGGHLGTLRVSGSEEKDVFELQRTDSVSGLYETKQGLQLGKKETHQVRIEVNHSTGVLTYLSDQDLV